MKAESATIQDRALKRIFAYSASINKVEIPHRIAVTFRLGKNKKGNSIIRMEAENDHFYCRLILRNIR